MQMKMYRCDGHWFREPNEIIEYFKRNGFIPPAQGGLDAIIEITKGTYHPVPSSPALPKSFSLQDKMPPVYDQASRGTCVAQAATALMEYYTECKWRFSMQYLFERIKRLEKDKYVKAALEIANGETISDPKIAKKAGVIAEQLRMHQLDVTPENVAMCLAQEKVSLADGSYGYMAMEVLAKYGICTYSKWPYSRQLLKTNASVDATRPDMPPGADEEAERHRLLDTIYEFPTPNNVEEIKRYLVGASGNRPMPVMVGVNVLDNLAMDGDRLRMPKVKEWKIESAMCELKPNWAENGKIAGYRMVDYDESTLQGENAILTMDMQMDGGHEMLIVGYQDDDSVPGGGNFIVRNSWHKDWGKEGYCKMPYAFAELFIDEAMTIVQPLKDYEGDGYDGIMPVGSFSRQQSIPKDLKEYVVMADREQKDRNGRWTIAKGDLIIVDREGFADRFTEQNAQLFRRQGFSWSPVAKEANIQRKADGTVPFTEDTRPILTFEEERFFSGIESAFHKLPLDFPLLGGLRRGWFFGAEKATYFQCVADLAKSAGKTLRLYDVKGAKTRFRIAAMYLSNALKAGEEVGKMRVLLEEYEAQHPFDSAACTIAVIGSNMAISDVVQPLTSENKVRVVLDRYAQETGWRVGAESTTGDRAWNEWIVRLVPNTPRQWSEQIERAYEAIVATGGHVTLDKMSKETSFDVELLEALVGKFAPSLQVKGNQVIKR